MFVELPKKDFLNRGQLDRTHLLTLSCKESLAKTLYYLSISVTHPILSV